MDPDQNESTAPIEVLLLDVGGVLVSAPDQSLVTAVEHRLALAPGALSTMLYECDPWYGLSTGQLDESAYWQALAEDLGHQPLALQEMLEPVWEWGSDRADAAMLALATAARERVRVAILSNASPRLEARLHAAGASHLFDPIINSARIGLRKPDVRAYEYALALLDVPPRAVLFVDDKPRNTIVSRALGIPSHDFITVERLAAELRARGILPASPSI